MLWTLSMTLQKHKFKYSILSLLSVILGAVSTAERLPHEQKNKVVLKTV